MNIYTDVIAELFTDISRDTRANIAEEFRKRLPTWISNHLRPCEQYENYPIDFKYYQVMPCRHETSSLFTDIVNEEFGERVGIEYYDYNLCVSSFRWDTDERTAAGIAITIRLIDEAGEIEEETLYYRFHTTLNRISSIVDTARLPRSSDLSESEPAVLLQRDFLRNICVDWIPDDCCSPIIAAELRTRDWEEVRQLGEQILLIK